MEIQLKNLVLLKSEQLAKINHLYKVLNTENSIPVSASRSVDINSIWTEINAEEKKLKKIKLAIQQENADNYENIYQLESFNRAKANLIKMDGRSGKIKNKKGKMEERTATLNTSIKKQMISEIDEKIKSIKESINKFNEKIVTIEL